MTSRERVIKALNFQNPDRLPKDLSGMRSTGISAFAYPGLVKALGLPPRLPKVYDLWQMLAFPDNDILDALGCDVIVVDEMLTNAFPQQGKWQKYDFNGRLPAMVPTGTKYTLEKDGTIVLGDSRMVPESYVFDVSHGGQSVYLDGDIPRPDLDVIRKQNAANLFKDEEINEIVSLCKKVRESSDRAVFFANAKIRDHIGICAFGGMGVFPILCMTEPEFVKDLHEMQIERAIKNAKMLLPEIKDCIDVILLTSDDWGTQSSLIVPPEIYDTLFRPYLRRLNDACHASAPKTKTFMHSCGAIYDAIDIVIESGFDILNPVQWSAGTPTFKDWKDKARKRLCLWGGGINSQATLPLGTVSDVEKEVREAVSCLKKDNGYVFCNIHNILAEIAPEKVIAMYHSAEKAQDARPDAATTL